jgi:imidazoleglycerol-phosphate dehydratase
MSQVVRETLETSVTLSLRIQGESDGGGIVTPDPFLSHMLDTLARFAGWWLEIRVAGDLRHHCVEDAALTLGTALRDEIPPACMRFGSALVPMDDALVEAAVDVGGRPWYAGRMPSTLYEHFLRSLTHAAGLTLHVRVVRGRDRHHIVEAAFKAVGLALRAALQPAEKPFSTKGPVRLRPPEPA